MTDAKCEVRDCVEPASFTFKATADHALSHHVCAAHAYGYQQNGLLLVGKHPAAVMVVPNPEVST